IERQELNAAAPVNVLFTELRDGVRHHTLGTAVAVGDGQADAFAVFVQQHIVHAPGINADTVDTDAVLTHFLQPGADLRFQAIDIPAIKTILLFLAVNETMHFTKRKRALVTVPGVEHYTAAGCA